jgi:dUTP pyrophosphatase
MRVNRGFEAVSKEHRKHTGEPVIPFRADARSAGYDFICPVDVSIKPNEKKLIFTDIKAYMQDDEVLLLYVRSSIGVKRGLRLSNGTGVIDSSYFENPDNDGNIGIPLHNTSDKTVFINAGERIAQGVFTKYLIADYDNVMHDSRTGGFGSSGK